MSPMKRNSWEKFKYCEKDGDIEQRKRKVEE
jgi:hypothetical protein